MPSSFKDYYATLGVPRTASDEELKKAFRRLAREHHPDLHPTSEKDLHTRRMQDINEAYSVLSDPEKRAKYDRYGSEWEAAAQAEAQQRERPSRGTRPSTEGPQGFTGNGPEGFSDFFREFFGRERGSFSESEGTDRDIEAEAEVTLEDAVRGGERTFRLAVSRLCPTCHGTGRKDRQICPTCGGVGEIQEEKTITARIPPGVQEGTLLRLKGKGHAGSQGSPPGDLFVRIHLRPDPRFLIQGSDLETRLIVMPWVAGLGGEATAPTLEGPLRIRIPKGSHTGRRLRVAGKGLGKGGSARGDLYLRLEIDNPETLSPRAEALYRQLAEETNENVRSR